MKVEEIKSFIDSNKDNPEVQGFLKSIKSDGLVEFINSEEGFKIARPAFDAYATKAINTYKEKTLPNLVDEKLVSKKTELEAEFKKLYNIKDPENPEMLEMKKQIAELNKKLGKEESEKARLLRLQKAKDKLEAKEFSDFADRFIGETDEDTETLITKFNETYNNAITKGVEERLTGTKVTPGKPNVLSKGKELTDEDFGKMSPEQYAKYKKENPNYLETKK